jgi:hypothetical protein
MKNPEPVIFCVLIFKTNINLFISQTKKYKILILSYLLGKIVYDKQTTRNCSSFHENFQSHASGPLQNCYLQLITAP